MTVTVKKIAIEDGTQWIKLNGEDFGTGYVFDNDEYGVTEENEIVDSENCPITVGDYQEIAVRNSI